MSRFDLQTIVLRIVYAAILFVVTLATLEGFTQINAELFHVPNGIFHVFMLSTAREVAELSCLFPEWPFDGFGQMAAYQSWMVKHLLREIHDGPELRRSEGEG